MTEKTRKEMLESFEKHIVNGCSSEILLISRLADYRYIHSNLISKYCSGYEDGKNLPK